MQQKLKVAKLSFQNKLVPHSPAVESQFLEFSTIIVHNRSGILNSNLSQELLDQFLLFCSLNLRSFSMMFLATLKLLGI